MTWPEAGIDDHAIHGPSSALEGVAVLVDAMKEGGTVRIGEELADGTPYTLALDLRHVIFDPSSLDTNLAGDKPR
jgi:hypothetical protein